MDQLAGGLGEVAPLLAAFDAAAREGHITRAAELLEVPQSSISRRLKALERALGVQLFQPVGRRVALTVQGRDLHERTAGLLRQLDDAIDEVRADADPAHGRVRFGFPLTLGPVSIPSTLAHFHASAPGIRLHLTQAHGEALAEMVRDGSLDLAVTIPPPADLPFTMLGRQRILAHVALGHPLAGRTRVDLAELVEEPFIASPPSFHLRMLLDTWCAEAGFTPRVGFEISEFETIRELAAQGLGIALLPAGETPRPDLVGIPLTGVRDRAVGLTTGRHRPTAATTLLHAHLVTHAAGFVNLGS
ncbi:LysR family transcriptional regulator [Tomitella biformata]|uniref:LysR family transcriptional regulator n=1 Tax=Tomitella biformata TaxID=630403 RepID=UPI000467B6E0|nr:LysR family transcriptional regulator [Tomitella biformata]